ncbi:UNVERIFIED_CONTAM: hypothetical protein K2H54_041525 [Gekko kuhli]
MAAVPLPLPLLVNHLYRGPEAKMETFGAEKHSLGRKTVPRPWLGRRISHSSKAASDGVELAIFFFLSVQPCRVKIILFRIVRDQPCLPAAMGADVSVGGR